jgi:hypothetical protein
MDCFIKTGLLVSAAMMIAPAGAAARPSATDPLERLAQCKAIAADADRLACYDREVAALQTKVDAKELAIVDPASVRSATRTTPDGIPAGDNGETSPDKIQLLETMTTSVWRTGDNSVAFALPNGTQWQQTDSTAVFGLKAGAPVTLKRAAFGSYFARLGKNIPIRVKRTR